jgi:hypothetical protein
MVKHLICRYAVLAILAVPGLLPAQIGTEAVLPEGTRISLQLNDFLSTKQSQEGQPFTATVDIPVYLKDRIVIPKGSIISGSVSRILKPGRFRGKAQMNLIFSSVRLADSIREIAIVASLASIDPEAKAGTQAEGTISTEESKTRGAAKVATPTLVGAGIGAVVGSGRGAAIGAGVGAAVGLATILASRGADVELRRGCAMEIVLDRALAVPNEVLKRSK